METIIILLLLFIISILIVMIYKQKSSDDPLNKVQNALSEKFLSFQDVIHKTMEGTRKEVEQSKNIISDHALKTVDSIKHMGQTIEKIIQQQKEAVDLGNSLKYLLQMPKLRGSYGEEILEELLERILPKGIWERQFTIDGSERVDAIIRYKDIIVPIDAKFPRESYEKYLNSEDDENKKKYWKLYEDSIKLKINSIKSKYVKPHCGTSDFALMFIPSESIYYETIAEKNFIGQPCKIYEYARTNNVIPVSPNTFYAFMQIMLMGIRNLDIVKNAKKLQDSLAKIDRNFNLFYTKYSEIGQSIEKAKNAYSVADGHVNRLKDSLKSTLEIECEQKGKKERTCEKSGK